MYAVLCALLVIAVSGTTPTSTDNGVAKRQILGFYPDWVPFKNKHGDELGEFVDVTKPKAKVKKRLAPPMNFLLRAVSDDAEDYLGQGETDSEDYYDKKDWSDVNRVLINTTSPSTPVLTEPHSDIDGVLNIITQPRPDLAEEIKKSLPKHKSTNDDDTSEDNLKAIKKVEYSSTPTPTIETTPVIEVLTPKPNTGIFNKDYEEEVEASSKSSELAENEQKENEEKKKIILNSVDELKERHAEEQRLIAEKTKDEEFDNIFRHKNVILKKNRAMDTKRQRGKATSPNYDEYEDLSWKDKYNINVERKTTTDQDVPKLVRTSPIRISTTKSMTEATPKKEDSKAIKYSVFRNPSLYMVEDDEDVKSTKTTKTPKRFSSRYTTNPQTYRHKTGKDKNNIHSESQAPILEKVEPILYFPKMKPKKKHNKARKHKTTYVTTQAPDSSVAETVEDKLTKHTTQSITYPDTTANDKTTVESDFPTSTDSLWKDDSSAAKKDKDDSSTEATTNDEGNTTAMEQTAETGNSEIVTDALPASSDHTQEEPKDYHVEKGGGHQHHSSHEEEHEEHGKKAYEGLHRNTKSKKGHHDKEDHLGKYEDRGGHNKEHHDESGHYGAHHHEEHGKKHAKYEESGKHSKGHSTKGSHDIHKKDEYEKKVEFFEEEGDSAEEEKHGGYHNEKEHKEGGEYKKGNFEKAHNEKQKGESGHFLKGDFHKVNKGHKSSGGHDGHGKHGHAHHGSSGHHSGNKWVYHHGNPAKTANLVRIDRRTDRYMHGPNYYG